MAIELRLLSVIALRFFCRLSQTKGRSLGVKKHISHILRHVGGEPEVRVEKRSEAGG